jgi:hypothetical protein
MNYHTQEVLAREKLQGLRRTAQQHRSIQKAKDGQSDDGKSNFSGKFAAVFIAIITLAAAVTFLT